MTAVLCVAVSTAVKAGLGDYLGARVPYVTFFPAIVVAALFGGLFGGLLATALSGYAASYWIDPISAPFIRNPSDWVPMGVFLASGGLVSGVCEVMHRAQAQLLSSERQARLAEEQKREALQRYELLAQHGSDIILFVRRRDGRILEANEAALRAYDMDREQLLSRTIHDLHAPEDRPATGAHLGADDNADLLFQTVHCRKDGSSFPVEVSARGMEIGGDHVLVEVIRDTTERKRLEGELQARALDLRAADRAKDQFLAMLAHELRNPLGAISNAATLIEMQAEGRVALQKPVEILNRQVRHTVRLVDDLLDVSRITRGKFELRKEPVDLVSTLQRAAETARPQMAVRQHAFSVNLPADPVWMEADPARLEQVAGNLLNNAAKYTDPGGRITLSLAVRGCEAEIRVQDNGNGISPDNLDAIFDLFAQEDRSLARSRGGLGIGLTMVKNLVEMHQGSVTAYSEGPARGSTFVIRLPLLEGIEEEAKHPPSMPPTRARRILVVDDNVDAAQTIAELLEISGHEVFVAHDGPTAIEAALNLRPDTMLLDIGLPGMDGYEVARYLRENGALSHILLVALTGYGHEDDRKRSLEAGFTHHLVKPVDLAILQGLLA